MSIESGVCALNGRAPHAKSNNKTAMRNKADIDGGNIKKIKTARHETYAHLCRKR